jgi:hypothetical protein
MDIMATTASYPALFHRMMGLFILLGPDVFVARIAPIGLLDLRELIPCPMHGMTVVARYPFGLVLAHIPGRKML